jgi:phosphoglycerol transferase
VSSTYGGSSLLAAAPPDAPPAPRLRLILVESAVFALLSAMLLFWWGGLEVSKLGQPMGYSGDALHYQAAFRGIAETGWYLHNPRLGAPFGLVHHDFPTPDFGTLVAVRALTLLQPDPFFVFNALFLGSFALVAFTGYAVARRWGLPAWLCAVVATAFNLLPFHFERIHHLFYTGYFTVPLFTYVALRLMAGESSLASPRHAALRFALVAACSTFGLYNAVFAIALLAFAAVYAVRQHRAAALEAAAMCAVIVATVALCLAPNILHRMQAGPNREVPSRLPQEGEIYALRASLLALPPPEHRVPALAEVGRAFQAHAPMLNENRWSWLGTAGAIGFLASILLALVPLPPGGRWEATRVASRANLFMLLFATMGGLGAIFNYVVWPQIRAYNRASVFLAYLSLLVLAMALVRLLPLLGRLRPLPGAIAMVVALSLVAIDQAPVRGHFANEARKFEPQFAPNHAFGQALDRALAPGAMVFQLPHVRFPESPAPFHAGAYDGFMPYLHSRNPRFTYAAMRGRLEGQWLATLAMRPVPELAAALEQYGFAALMVDRAGLADNGAAAVALLQAAGKKVIASNHRFVAFALSPRGTPAGIPLPSLEWGLGTGFHGVEIWEGGRMGSWCSGRCTIHLQRSAHPVVASRPAADNQVDFVLTTRGDAREVFVELDGKRVKVLPRGEAQAVVRVLLPAARERVELRLDSDLPPTPGGPGDARRIAFGLSELKVERAAAPVGEASVVPIVKSPYIAEEKGQVVQFPAVGGQGLATAVGTSGPDGLHSSGRAGYLQFGPYASLGPGSYRVTWIGRAESAGRTLVDVSSDSGRTILVKAAPLRPSGATLATADFTLDAPASKVEFRMAVDESARLVLERVTIEKR